MTINEITQRLFNFFLNPKSLGEFYNWLLFYKTIFILISLLLSGFIIFALINTSWLKRIIVWDLKEILTRKPYIAKKYAKKWKKIKQKAVTGLESERKLAVLEADEILDESLKTMGYPGKDLDERLVKITTEILPNLEKVKEVRKIRNNIIHDPDYRLDWEDTELALEVYEKAFNIFELI